MQEAYAREDHSSPVVACGSHVFSCRSESGSSVGSAVSTRCWEGWRSVAGGRSRGNTLSSMAFSLGESGRVRWYQTAAGRGERMLKQPLPQSWSST